MKRELNLKDIENQFCNPNWTTDLITDSFLVSNQIELISQLVIGRLNSKNPFTRFISCQMIIEFNIEAAKSKLIERILNKDTLNSNGTMTYALLHLNCEDSLVDVFKILASQSWESKNHAYSILSNQTFTFSGDDLVELEKIWKGIVTNQIENQIFEKETLEMIEDAYLGFKDYMKEIK